MNIRETLDNGVKDLRKNNIKEFFLKARILLSYTLNKEKEYLITHDSYELTEEEINRYNSYIKRLLENEPLQHITQTQEFMELKFKVNNEVLIPRQDTEVLTEEVISICREHYLR